MREIKFRAWDNEACAMRDWEYLLLYSPIRVWKGGTFDLMQYTGFKDKNGKEIYEGDIARFGESAISTYVVEFNDGCFNVKFLHEGYLTLGQFVYIEIIGNIYENPELIKKYK